MEEISNQGFLVIRLVCDVGQDEDARLVGMGGQELEVRR